MSENDSVDSAPAIAHTNIDTSFGLMPERRARSAFSADALTLLPNVVRVRNQREGDRDQRHDDQDRSAARR